MCKYFYFLTLLFITASSGFAQTTTSSIHVSARAQNDRIVIRWAVDSPIEWQNTNKHGFVLNRMLIKKDGKLIDNPEKKQLAIVKAEPLEAWMDFIQEDQYGAIVAQALYGDSFEVGQESESELANIINIADELSQRYTFALF